MTLTEFLAARIAEDEAAARATEHEDGPQTLTWRSAGARHHRFDNGRRESYQAVYCGGWDRILVARDDVRGGPVAAHIARHDPARVLAECEAKRRRVEWAATNLDEDAIAGDWSDRGMDATVASDIAEWLLKVEALPYADRPGFQEAWRA